MPNEPRRPRLNLTTFLLAALVALPAAVGARDAAAHGVRAEVDAGPITTVTVTHDDGTPLADTPFTVMPPDGSAAFLSGSTDASGRVSFRPDRPGAWKVRIAAVDGHGAVVTVNVDSAWTEPPTGAPATAAPVTMDHEHDDDHGQDHGHDHGHDHGSARDHESLHGHDHPGAHDHDHDPAPAAGGGRWTGAAAGLVVLLLALVAGGALLRRR